jgi:RNA-directed DNA polymerase
MNVEQPQRDQDSGREPASHDPGGSGGTGTAAFEVMQAFTASHPQRALTIDLMEQVCSPKNLLRAYRRVRANKGAPGVDRMLVGELADWLREHQEALIASLRAGTYQPQPVRGVEIPKPGGGKRQLGIPAVVDGLVQQAILQVLEPLLDPTFSESSFGFRPKRSAHDALRQARKYVSQGRHIVVDLDLEKFFDRVNHTASVWRARKALRKAGRSPHC